MLKDDAYKIVSDMVEKGFITVGVNLSGISFVFKTINDEEYKLIKLHSGIQTDGHGLKFNTFFLAFSVLLVDGENVLSDRSKHIKILYDFFSRIPLSLHTKIIFELEALKEDIIGATKFLEGFCYTGHSRILWKERKTSPNRDEFTGIKGTESLGMNFCQGFWVRLNRTLDEEDAYNEQFSFASLIASASNPKGTRILKSKHDGTLQAIEGKRKKLAREGSIPDKPIWTPEGWAAPVDTAEELVAELERQMRGYKDKHDLFIENYIRQLQEREARIKAEKEKKQAEYRERTKDEALITGSQRALTPQETKEMLEKSRVKPNNLMILPSEEIADPQQRDRYFRKIGSKVLTGRK
jgi:hypothetical protein